jgi:hypothetical protein
MNARRSPYPLLAAILILAAAGPAAAQAAPPGGCPAGTSCEPTMPAYPFFRSDDEVALAMRQLWLAQFEAAADPAAHAKRFGAQAVILANREIAAAYLLDTLAMLSPLDEAGHTSLQPLLDLLGDAPEILAFLGERLAEPSPGTVAQADESPIPPAQRVRDQALDQIVTAAKSGSEAAQQSVFRLLTSSDPRVRAGAVQGIYQFSASRSAAQRAMRRMLDVDDHYLLFRY